MAIQAIKPIDAIIAKINLTCFHLNIRPIDSMIPMPPKILMFPVSGTNSESKYLVVTAMAIINSAVKAVLKNPFC